MMCNHATHLEQTFDALSWSHNGSGEDARQHSCCKELRVSGGRKEQVAYSYHTRGGSEPERKRDSIEVEQ